VFGFEENPTHFSVFCDFATRELVDSYPGNLLDLSILLGESLLTSGCRANSPDLPATKF
jgi:hypothetical protein